MHGRAIAVVLGVGAALGCGRIGPGVGEPRGAKHQYPHRPCAESIQARAEGRYTSDDDDGERYLIYYTSCRALCDGGGGAPVCVEAALLNTAQGLTRGGVSELVDFCTAGEPQACAWVASNQGQIDAHERYWAEVEAQREYEAEQAAARRAQYETDAASLEGVLMMIIDELSAEGYALQLDTLVSLAWGSASVKFSITKDTEYAFVLVAVRGTTFNASVGGGGAYDSVDFDVVDVDPAVYALTTRIELGRYATAGEPVVSLFSTGGDGGDVHVMRFERSK